MRHALRASVRRPAPLVGVLLLVLAPVVLTACNTVEGAGEDIEAAGDAINDAADDAND